MRLRRLLLRLIPLRPNCLLTRHPLVLISSNGGLGGVLKSFFWYELILRAHGYEVFALKLKIGPVDLSQLNPNHPWHVVLESELRPVLPFDGTRVCSLTSVQTSAQDLGLWRNWRRQLLSWREQILNLAISLAENDLKCSH